MAKNQNNKFDPMKVALATGGGALGFTLMYQLEKNISQFRDNPKLTPLTNIAVATGINYFTNGKYDAFCYGMMGAGGSDLAMQIISAKAQTDNPQQQGVQEQAEEHIRQAEILVDRELQTEEIPAEEYTEDEQEEEEEYNESLV